MEELHTALSAEIQLNAQHIVDHPHELDPDIGDDKKRRIALRGGYEVLEQWTSWAFRTLGEDR